METVGWSCLRGWGCAMLDEEHQFHASTFTFCYKSLGPEEGAEFTRWTQKSWLTTF